MMANHVQLKHVTLTE